MPDLLRHPTGTRGKVHGITAESAGWGYVGFSLYRLEPGDVLIYLLMDLLWLLEHKTQL